MGTSFGRVGLVGAAVAALIATGVPRDAGAQTQIKPYIMILFDTSGSMSWTVASAATYGDSSADPWFGRTCCPGSGTSRMYACKNAMYRMLSATGDVQFGLMTFPMEIRSGTSAGNSYQSNQYYGNQVAGAWDYIRYRGPWYASECPPGGAWVNNYLKVRFDDFGGENLAAILDYMDHHEYSAAWTPVENELRADGGTPLAWTLGRARDYFATVLAGDSYYDCRPYKVILLTDGIPDCGAGETQATFWNAVTALRTTTSAGRTKDVRTCVIGYSSSGATLDGAAQRGQCLGGETTAFSAVSEDQLAAALFRIIDGTVLTEICDNADNDCDTLIDEGFTKYCNRPSHPAQDLCVDPGETLCNGVDDNCNGATDEGLLNACGGCGPLSEVCGDSVDNDCDTATDEGCPIGCVPEICDGVDNDCDTVIDDGIGSRACGSDVGQCSYGTQSCTGGAWGACTGGVGPVAETCNSLDDDCDGMTDGMTRTCGTAVGVCELGSQICTSGAWGACAGGYSGGTEVCNLLDDDCDGLTDEGNPGGGASCGTDVGECVRGTMTCTGGALVCTGGTSAVPEACNNRDDDCDGLTDEGNPGGGAACYTGPAPTRRVGACTDGVMQCTAGALVCGGQTLPAAELCNGVDDDCDGATDEGIAPRSCGTGVGECVVGSETCVSGAWVCSGGTGPVAELCNNRDDDCDGATDELNPGGGVGCGWNPADPSVWDLGACDPGVTQCTGGAIVCVGMVGPSTELCNGADDDCDGLIDDGATASITCVPPPPGICTAGTPTCVGGVPVCVGEVPGTTEICNNIDDDCDGSTDEGLMRPCGTDEGACALGSQTCAAGVWGACLGGTGAVPETCNNVDDDCDGVTDGVTRPCGNDAGECVAGTETCWAGAWGVCVGGIGPATEICNGLDDDCDTSTDEGDPGGGASCGGSVGECLPGTVRCLGGRLACDGGSEAVPELCDLLDNDCDGTTDEGNPGGGADCYTGPAATRGIGVCEDGVTQCVAGAFVCSGETLPRAEDCNGLDDDCDGATDEGLATGICGTDEGECTAGTRRCDAGAWICDGEVGPTTEVCNLLDDDCNGSTDEGNPGGGVACGWDPGHPETWDLGLCEPGIANCEDGAIVCLGVIGPAPEECNGLDDDCNGLTDDGLSLGEPCGLDVGDCDPGRLQCVGGLTECVGGTLPDVEICDCGDNDCDAETDEGDLCGGGAVCLDCSCATPCTPGEFSCVDPLVCECDIVPERPLECFCVGAGLDCGGETCGACQDCVAETCTPRVCADCEECNPATDACQDVCADVPCDPGITECVCVDGDDSCEAINCYLPGRECPEGFRCEAAACVEDPCYTVSCPVGRFCRDGDCYDVCETGITCADGEICVDGSCVDDPCFEVVCINPDDVCVDGYCPEDPGSPCDGVDCPWPQVCRGGECVDDPCAFIDCPVGSECERGTCIETGGADADADADAGDADAGADGADGEDDVLDRARVLGTGAGGCACRAAGGGEGSLATLLGLLGVSLLLWRRRGGSAARAASAGSAGSTGSRPAGPENG